MQTGPTLTRSPTFNGYSRSLADIAARVVEEFNAESDQSGLAVFYGFDYDQEVIKGDENWRHAEEANNLKEGDDEADSDDDDDAFEFNVNVGGEAVLCSNSADGILRDGQFRPIYPVFCRNWSFGGLKDDATKPPVPRPSRLSLRKLMSEDRDPPSRSSAETDELDGVPAEMYCMWKPMTAEEREQAALSGKCKNSRSIGSSSNRWKFRNFLQRSNSDIKDALVRLSRKDSTKSRKISDEKGRTKATTPADGDKTAQYIGNKGDRRRSVIPYRQDLEQNSNQKKV